MATTFLTICQQADLLKSILSYDASSQSRVLMHFLLTGDTRLRHALNQPGVRLSFKVVASITERSIPLYTMKLLPKLHQLVLSMRHGGAFRVTNDKPLPKILKTIGKTCPDLQSLKITGVNYQTNMVLYVAIVGLMREGLFAHLHQLSLHNPSNPPLYYSDDTDQVLFNSIKLPTENADIVEQYCQLHSLNSSHIYYTTHHLAQWSIAGVGRIIWFPFTQLAKLSLHCTAYINERFMAELPRSVTRLKMHIIQKRIVHQSEHDSAQLLRLPPNEDYSNVSVSLLSQIVRALPPSLTQIQTRQPAFFEDEHHTRVFYPNMTPWLIEDACEAATSSHNAETFTSHKSFFKYWTSGELHLDFLLKHQEVYADALPHFEQLKYLKLNCHVYYPGGPIPRRRAIRIHRRLNQLRRVPLPMAIDSDSEDDNGDNEEEEAAATPPVLNGLPPNITHLYLASHGHLSTPLASCIMPSIFTLKHLNKLVISDRIPFETLKDVPDGGLSTLQVLHLDNLVINPLQTTLLHIMSCLPRQLRKATMTILVDHQCLNQTFMPGHAALDAHWLSGAPPLLTDLNLTINPWHMQLGFDDAAWVQPQCKILPPALHKLRLSIISHDNDSLAGFNPNLDLRHLIYLERLIIQFNTEDNTIENPKRRFFGGYFLPRRPRVQQLTAYQQSTLRPWSLSHPDPTRRLACAPSLRYLHIDLVHSANIIFDTSLDVVPIVAGDAEQTSVLNNDTAHYQPIDFATTYPNLKSLIVMFVTPLAIIDYKNPIASDFLKLGGIIVNGDNVNFASIGRAPVNLSTLPLSLKTLAIHCHVYRDEDKPTLPQLLNNVSMSVIDQLPRGLQKLRLTPIKVEPNGDFSTLIQCMADAQWPPNLRQLMLNPVGAQFNFTESATLRDNIPSAGYMYTNEYLQNLNKMLPIWQKLSRVQRFETEHTGLKNVMDTMHAIYKASTL